MEPRQTARVVSAPTLEDIRSAKQRIRGISLRTPLIPLNADRAPADIYLKMENLQVTGSFKVRGAATRLLALSPEERAQGVVACSSGNHGRAVAYVAGLLEIPATICVPNWVEAAKLEGIRSAGAEVVFGASDGRVYVLDLASGEERWSYEIGKAIVSSPAVVDGRILVTGTDGVLYAFGAREERGD